MRRVGSGGGGGGGGAVVPWRRLGVESTVLRRGVEDPDRSAAHLMNIWRSWGSDSRHRVMLPAASRTSRELEGTQSPSTEVACSDTG